MECADKNRKKIRATFLSMGYGRRSRSAERVGGRLNRVPPRRTKPQEQRANRRTVATDK
jgi:hypothetical protein